MKIRLAARVVLLNHRDEVFMLQCRDLGDDSRRHWLTVGGGAELGESSEQTAVRELAEETGIECDPGELMGPLAMGRVSIEFTSGVHVQDEVYYGMRCPAEVDFAEAVWNDIEKQTIVDARWWSLDDIARSSERIYPAELPKLMEFVIAGSAPAAPLRLGAPLL